MADRETVGELEARLAGLIDAKPAANTVAGEIDEQRINFAWGNNAEEVRTTIEEVRKVAENMWR